MSEYKNKYFHESVPFLGVGTSTEEDGTWERQVGPWSTVVLGLGTLDPAKVHPKKGEVRDIKVKAGDSLGVIPGVCDVKVSRGRKSEKKAAFRSSGAVIIPHGVELASVTISVQIWTRDQLARMLDLLDRIDPRIGPQADDKRVLSLAEVQAYDIQHPATRMRKVNAIFIDKVDGPDVNSDGIITFTIAATQWVPIVDAGPKPAKPADRSLGLTGGVVTDGRSQVGGNLGGFDIPAPPGPSKPGAR